MTPGGVWEAVWKDAGTGPEAVMAGRKVSLPAFDGSPDDSGEENPLRPAVAGLFAAWMGQHQQVRDTAAGFEEEMDGELPARPVEGQRFDPAVLAGAAEAVEPASVAPLPPAGPGGDDTTQAEAQTQPHGRLASSLAERLTAMEHCRPMAAESAHITETPFEAGDALLRPLEEPHLQPWPGEPVPRPDGRNQTTGGEDRTPAAESGPPASARAGLSVAIAVPGRRGLLSASDSPARNSSDVEEREAASGARLREAGAAAHPAPAKTSSGISGESGAAAAREREPKPAQPGQANLDQGALLRQAGDGAGAAAAAPAFDGGGSAGGHPAMRTVSAPLEPPGASAAPGSRETAETGQPAATAPQPPGQLDLQVEGQAGERVRIRLADSPLGVRMRMASNDAQLAEALRSDWKTLELALRQAGWQVRRSDGEPAAAAPLPALQDRSPNAGSAGLAGRVVLETARQQSASGSMGDARSGQGDPGRQGEFRQEWLDLSALRRFSRGRK